MSLDGHVISTGADGVLVGMPPDDVTAVMNRTLRSDRLVMHFHGGLVDEAWGMKVAEDLLPIYAGAGAYPVVFVWRTGALEILRNNILEIAREDFFDRLIRRLLGWAVGKVRGEEEGGRGGPMQRPSQQELDEQLGARKHLTDPDAGSEPFADEQTTPQPFELEPGSSAGILIYENRWAASWSPAGGSRTRPCSPRWTPPSPAPSLQPAARERTSNAGSTSRSRVMVGEPDGIGLADALEGLRAELASAQAKAAGTEIQFPIETLTVELKVGVTRSAEGKAGFRVPFVGAELGGSAGYDRETLQTVTLVMGAPLDRDGRPVRVAQASQQRKD
jgi:hypothetical protein